MTGMAPALIAASVLAAGMVLAPPALACSSAVAAVGVDLPTLHLEVTADRGSYRRGHVATLRVEVTQVTAGGPPVRDAITAVHLAVGERRVHRVGGSTDAAGRLVLRFVVPRSSPLGPVRADATSHARLLVSPECEDLLSSSGSTTVDPVMTTRG